MSVFEVHSTVSHRSLMNKSKSDLAHLVLESMEIADRQRQRADVAEQKINTPELLNFAEGVVLEAAHQRERWGAAHDVGKAPADWFWLLGYLAGKALAAAQAGDAEKALHHTISSAAVLANWHASLAGDNTQMRPGIAEEAQRA